MRQGDPLSPYLFILAVASLAISIRQNVDIKGIKIENYEVKLLQYADDTTAILSDENSAKTLFEDLEVFKKFIGLEINSSKTEGMWIGSPKRKDEKPFGIKWSSEPIKASGTFFTYDQSLLYDKNFQEKVDSIKKLTNKWSSRGLSIYGKVTTIKSLLIPKLVFISSVFSPPSKIIKQVNSMIFSFLWNGEDNVTRLSSINSPEDGGIKMTDIESLDKAVRLAWLKSIFSDNESTWKFYLLHLLCNVGGLLLFICNYAMNDLSINSVSFLQRTLRMLVRVSKSLFS